MATFNTQDFITKAKGSGFSDDQINEYLKKRGIDPASQQQEFQTGIRGFATGALKELAGAARGTSNALIQGGRYIQAAVDPFNTVDDLNRRAAEQGGKGILGDVIASTVRGSEQDQQMNRQLTPVGEAERAGANTAFVAELASPLAAGKVRAVAGGISSAVGRGSTRTLGSGTSKVTEAVLGTEGKGAVEQAFTDPSLQRRVLSGEITPASIADKAKGAATSFRTQSIKALDEVKEGLENFNVGKRKATKAINEAIKEAVGLAEDAKVKFDNLPVTVESERILNKLQQTILGHRDWSRKGLLELRELIDRQKFYKYGNSAYQDSNQVITAVRSRLNDLVAGGDEAFKEALTKASDDIRFLEQLGINVLGKNRNNVTLSASKINTLLKEITDPGVRTRALELLQRLASETGSPIIKELEALARSRTLTAPLPGLREPFTTGARLLERGVAAGARAAGSARDGVRSLMP